MLFLMQDCSFDSLGISSVAVYLVDMGNAHGNVLAVFISLSGSKMRPCFALLFFTIKFGFKFKVHAKYTVIKI